MKNIKDIISEKLIISKNIKINNKNINKDTYKPFNIIKSVDDYVDRIFYGYGIKARKEIRDFLEKYIKGEVLIYLIQEHSHGDGYKLNNDIYSDLSKEAGPIEIKLDTFSKVMYKVFNYGDQYVIYEYPIGVTNSNDCILIDGK